MSELSLLFIPLWIYSGWRLPYTGSVVVVALCLIGAVKYTTLAHRPFSFWPADDWPNPAAFLFALSISMAAAVAISAHARLVFDMSRRRRPHRK